MSILFIVQDPIAPSSGYEIGYTIGQYLPFVILVIIAYLLFRHFKNNSQR